MDPPDYPAYYSNQSYSQYSSTSSPYISSASYQPTQYNTSSGSEYGSYDYEVNSPADDAEQAPQRRRRGAGSSTASAGSASSTSVRRREQNRLAQRALRQRRETHIRTLEDRILHSSLETRHLASENSDLSRQLEHLTLANDALRRSNANQDQASGFNTGAPFSSTHAYSQSAYSASQHASYGAAASPYQQYTYTAASTPSSLGDPTTSSSTWPYDATYQCHYGEGQQDYSAAHAQQYPQHHRYQQEYGDDDGDDDDDDEESEEEDQKPTRNSRRGP